MAGLVASIVIVFVIIGFVYDTIRSFKGPFILSQQSFLLCFVPGLLVSFLAAVGVYNSVMNNAYHYGATLFDSGFFANVIWRSGLIFELGPVFTGSYYTAHAATVNYIPSLFSYLWCGDRMGYFAFVYGLLFFAIIYTAYAIMLPMIAGRFAPWLAALGAALLFCGQSMFDSTWEMRSEFFVLLFLPLAFLSWQRRHYKWALLWFILSSSVREDIGIMIVVPVVLLSGLQWWEARKRDPSLAHERLVWGILISFVSFVLAVSAIYIQKTYFPVYDMLQDQYYDISNIFGHLSWELIDKRLVHHWMNTKGIWMPLAVLAIAALLMRDLQLMVGVFAFMPYLLFVFFSNCDLSSGLYSYKSFLLLSCFLWPALIAHGSPMLPRRRRNLMLVQAAVLVCGMFYMYSGGWYTQRYERWFPQKFTANGQLYRDFGERQLMYEISPGEGATRASHSILALYPYSFTAWWDSWITPMRPEDASKVRTLIWFENDRDQAQVDALLKSGDFEVKTIEATKIRVAHRRSGEVRGVPFDRLDPLDPFEPVE
jgi:hypothetical protein